MKPLVDYYYRFPQNRLGIGGRCRVRIYQRGKNARTVLLTELASSSGESITSASERIAADLVARKGLNPKTTRWIQHDLPDGEQPQTFDEVKFTWGSDRTASDPQWQQLDEGQAEALTGDSLEAINRRLGDMELPAEEGAKHGGAKT